MEFKRMVNGIFRKLSPHAPPTPFEAQDFVSAAEQGDLVKLQGYLARFGSTIANAVVKRDRAPDRTALTEAIFKNQPEVFRLLLEAGVDVNARNSYHQPTPLMECARQCRNSFMDLMLKRDADVNAQDDEGMTALMHAARNTRGGASLVAQLLAAGADIDIEDKTGKTVLHPTYIGTAAIKSILNAYAEERNKLKPDNAFTDGLEKSIHVAKGKLVLQAPKSPPAKNARGL